jgi:hypothetical protein
MSHFLSLWWRPCPGIVAYDPEREPSICNFNRTRGREFDAPLVSRYNEMDWG